MAPRRKYTSLYHFSSRSGSPWLLAYLDTKDGDEAARAAAAGQPGLGSGVAVAPVGSAPAVTAPAAASTGEDDGLSAVVVAKALERLTVLPLAELPAAAVHVRALEVWRRLAACTTANRPARLPGLVAFIQHLRAPPRAFVLDPVSMACALEARGHERAALALEHFSQLAWPLAAGLQDIALHPAAAQRVERLFVQLPAQLGGPALAAWLASHAYLSTPVAPPKVVAALRDMGCLTDGEGGTLIFQTEGLQRATEEHGRHEVAATFAPPTLPPTRQVLAAQIMVVRQQRTREAQLARWWLQWCSRNRHFVDPPFWSKVIEKEIERAQGARETMGLAIDGGLADHLQPPPASRGPRNAKVVRDRGLTDGLGAKESARLAHAKAARLAEQRCAAKANRRIEHDSKFGLRDEL